MKFKLFKFNLLAYLKKILNTSEEVFARNVYIWVELKPQTF